MDFLAGVGNDQFLNEAHIKSLNEKIFLTPVSANLYENYNLELTGVDTHGGLYTDRSMLKRVNHRDVDMLTYKQYVQQVFNMGILLWWTNNMKDVDQFSK